MTTKNLVIMSTDIVKSTGTTASLNRKEYDQFREKYNQLLIPLVERASGQVFKPLGDGYLVSFESSTNAVIAGLHIQEQLKTLIASFHLDQRFATRIGLSSGDVNIEGSDRFGLPVILATRLQSIAEPFSTYFSESIFLTMNRNEVSYDDLGYISLKGLQEKTRVFKAHPPAQSSSTDTYAVLCTDIGGLTQMLGEFDVKIWEELLGNYDEIIFKHVLNNHGFLRYNVGDLYLITFKHTANALAAALAIHKEFQESRILTNRFGLSLPIQLGLDFGKLTIISGRFYGTSISRISPAMAHVSRGQIVVTKMFLDELQKEDSSVNHDLEYKKEEDLKIKGFEDPLVYYSVI